MTSYIYFLLILPWQKVNAHRSKTILLCLPVILLTAFLTGISVVNASFNTFVHQQILPTIRQHEQVITLNNSLGEQEGALDPGTHAVKRDSPKYQYFRTSEVGPIERLEGVKSVGSGLAASELMATGPQLINNQHIVFDRFSGLASSTAQHLGIEDFSYQPGQTLPIVVGLQAVKQYLIDPVHPDQSDATFLTRFQKNNTLLKTVDDAAVVASLVGQEFDIQFGGLAWQPVVYRVAGEVDNTFTYIPPSTAATLYRQYLDRIDQYWYVDQLKQGLAIRVKVVAVDGTISPNSVSLPNQAIAAIHQQLAARLAKAQRSDRLVPVQQLGHSFRGIAVTNNRPSPSGGYLWYIDLPDHSQQLPPIFIPGLYYQAGNGQQAARVLTDAQVSQLDFPIDQLTVVVNDLEHKVDIGNKLFFSGYQQGKSTPFHYNQALNFVEVVDQTTRIMSIAFMVIALIATFFLTIRAVRESEYDVGVARLLGATQGQTLALFCGLFIQQLLLAIMVGCLVGYAIVQAVAPMIANMLIEQNQFQSQQIAASYGRHITILATDFYHLDWSQLLTDLGVVVAVSLVGLLCAALLASRIQPFVLVNHNRS